MQGEYEKYEDFSQNFSLNFQFEWQVSFTYYCAAPRPGQEIRIDMASLRPPKVRWEARKDRWYTMIMASTWAHIRL